MASLIKNQIVKHLSKFAKNLSADQINLSTLRGEGELANLELNEEVFMDLLELPSWLKLTRIICNRVAFKIQWTKLKSVPIILALDEVVVDVETCEDLRMSSMAPRIYGSKYGFVDRVIDSVTATVNSVDINIKSSAFEATLQVSRVRLESRTPSWQRGDLRMTRLKDTDRGELLIFKELEWQMMRLEAYAKNSSQPLDTPIRLIWNQSRSRIIIKKRITDSAILASRVVLILDDLLWVLTTIQLQAAQHCMTYIASLVQKAKEFDQKIKAAHQLELMPGGPAYYLQAFQNKQNSKLNSSLAKVFARYDIVETSLHLYLRRIDLHFFDDSVREAEGPLRHLAEGSAMQVSLFRLAVDLYPYHFVAGERKHWLRYETITPRSAWSEQLMVNFRNKLMCILNPENVRLHQSLHRAQSTTNPQENRRQSVSSGRNVASNVFRKLMSTCIVLRLDDFVVYKVTTSATKKQVPEKFFCSDKERHLLPADMPTVHVEYTEYYYPGDESYPIPMPNVHVNANPVQLMVDNQTILWLNAFLLTLQKAQLGGELSIPDYVRPMDVRVEALMPRAIYHVDQTYANQPDRPQSIQVQVSRLVATNSRIGDRCGRADLEKCLESFQQGTLFYTAEFPSDESDFNPIVDVFIQHAMGADSGGFGSFRSSISSGVSESMENVGGGVSGGSTPCATLQAVKDFYDTGAANFPEDLFWTENKAIWCIQLDPVWSDFYGMASSKNQPAPFVDAVPITLWIYQNLVSVKERLIIYNEQQQQQRPIEASQDQSKLANPLTGGHTGIGNAPPGIFVLTNAEALINVQINHYQWVFVKRMTEKLADLGKQVAADAAAILDLNNENFYTVGAGAAILPEISVSVVMPLSPPKRDTPEDGDAAEVESLMGDLSSGGCTAALGGGLRETISDNHLSRGSDASKDGKLAVSCSDYVLHSKTSGSVYASDINGGSTPSTPGQLLPDEQQPIAQPLDTLKPSPSPINQATGSAEALNPGSESTSPLPTSLRMPHKLAEIFGPAEKMPDHLEKTLTSGSNAVKKGFSNLMASLDSSLPMLGSQKVSPGTLGKTGSLSGSVTGQGPNLFFDDSQLPDDALETMSVRSDMSSDSDQFILLNVDTHLLDDTLIPRLETSQPPAEIGSEAKEDSSSEPSAACSFKRLDLLSIMMVRLGGIEVCGHSNGFDVAIRSQCSRFLIEEHGTLTWEDFQTKFASSSRAWQEESSKYTLPFSDLRARFQAGPGVTWLGQDAVDWGFLWAVASETTVNIQTTSLNGLTQMLEDEITSRPVPLRILLHNIKVHLQEDRPSPYLTSIGSEPFELEVSSLAVLRNADGIFRIQSDLIDPAEFLDFTGRRRPSVVTVAPVQATVQEASTQVSPEPDSPRSERSSSSIGRWVSSSRRRKSSLEEDSDEKLFMLQEENDQLRLRMINGESVLRENERLKEQLRGEERMLKEAQEEVRQLTDEKRTLVATLQVLQEQLNFLEKGKVRTHATTITKS